ncbi:hydroquinone glucosyltransferase [Punica granatum]|uniref:Glycosyltransferase n=2 Tax=Punica granatum TaxID=22663 RepID=A0A218W856_PUNGR|nr:hydroquinone glucosyltransferase [Punica granatum]OWM68669.1 hypothetical protein CDL15_Pgr023634 [Punica granatum]PKI76655.1 hypothetical protein CRG98_002964 [Punica granatum]
MEQAQPPPAHIAILPTPGMGHLIPLIELAKRLVHRHCFTVTFIIPTESGSPSKAQQSVLSGLPPSISYIFLPPVSFDDLPEGTRIETIISLTAVRSLPALREALASIAKSNRLVSLVVDLFGTDAIDVAKEFNIAPYIFYPPNAMCLSLFFHLPTLDRTVSCEYRDLPEPVKILGCIPINGADLLDPVQDRRNDAYKWVLHHTKKYPLAEGIMVNSFEGLEGETMKALREMQQAGMPPVYAVGPLVNMEPSTNADGAECLKWLDEQPQGSVLYVSFGSGGTLSSKQMAELALGLEMSEQRFLWVARTPSDKAANASYFTVHGKDEAFDFLPEGFLERTKGRGFVLPSWAPQSQVLAHQATGGFVTHCGWNSTLESIVNGVPLIVWPLYAEQKMNAVLLTEGVRVALRPKLDEDGIVDREEVASVVKGLMEGEQGKRVRYRMKDLKEAAAKALSEDGSSTAALSEVARKWSTNTEPSP